MELDLTRLNRLAFIDFKEPPPERQPATSRTSHAGTFLEVGARKSTAEHGKPTERLAEGLEGMGCLQREADSRQREVEQAREVYRAYQQNIARSGQLQTDILNGVKAGENPYSLLLKAVKAISLMTSNGLLCTQVEADLKSVYGTGLLEPYPLQRELEELQGRLQLLREALQRDGEPEDSRQRIKSAIKAHEARESQIQELLKK